MTNTTTGTADTVHPFRIDIPQEELDDLRDRLTRTRWPRDLDDAGWQRGVPASFLRHIAEHWRDSFDWRAQEARLNELPQFTTTIDGQQVHFVHVRSEVPGARPLIMVHGWPSSYLEFLDVIGPLTNPEAHGGRAEDAVHLVIPSLPGFGFSPLSGAGWGDLLRVAGALAEVMTRLGYEQFLAQGTDVGSGIVGMLPMVAPGVGARAGTFLVDGRWAGTWQLAAGGLAITPHDPLAESDAAAVAEEGERLLDFLGADGRVVSIV
jgi:hypothetical protein